MSQICGPRENMARLVVLVADFAWSGIIWSGKQSKHSYPALNLCYKTHCMFFFLWKFSFSITRPCYSTIIYITMNKLFGLKSFTVVSSVPKVFLPPGLDSYSTKFVYNSLELLWEWTLRWSKIWDILWLFLLFCNVLIKKKHF